MINVSNEFGQLMQTRTDFKENAEITFANGTVLELKEKDFSISNNSVVDASDTNGIPLGVAVCRSIQIELMNDDDRFSGYDFFGAVIRLYLTFELSETVEKIEYGKFTVLTPETYGETVIITALDDMYKADKEYSTSLLFPETVKNILVDACDTIGIYLGTTSFLNDDFVVQSMPEGITYRQLFGYIAMIAGGNARIDTTGMLKIISYDFSSLDNIYNSVINGGSFNPWNNPTHLNGGTFNPWNTGDIVDGGKFGDRNNFHLLINWNNLKIDTDDVVITGVQTSYTDSDNEEHTILYGTEGYILKVENPLIEGQEHKAIDLIGNVMVGGKFRQFSGDLISNPTCEFMDAALIFDRKGNFYISFLTDINFQFFGFTTLKNSAEPTLRNSATTYSQATQTLVAARKLVNNEKTARELAIAHLANDLANSSGLFMTEETQPDGSTVYYMHDKPTLAHSMIVWKLTALAFGISTDGGKTFPYGFTVDGTTITRLLYAEGINADYINTGEMSANRIRGGTLTLGGNNNTNGKLSILNDAAETLGEWDSQGFWTKSADYSKPEISYALEAFPGCGDKKNKIEIKIIGAIGADSSNATPDGSYFTSSSTTPEVHFELNEPDGRTEEGCPYWLLSGKFILGHVTMISTQGTGYLKRIICTRKTKKRTITLFDVDYSSSSPATGVLMDLRNNIIESSVWKIENNNVYVNQRLKGQSLLLLSTTSTSSTATMSVEDLTNFSQLSLVSEAVSNGNIVNIATFPVSIFLETGVDGWLNNGNSNYASMKPVIETVGDDEIIDTESIYFKTSNSSYIAKLYGIV